MKTPSSISRGKTVANITENIRQMIYSGVLRKGEKLVQEKLAEQLGVSRVPLREAFVELASEGLVRLRSNRGAVVRGVSADEIQQLQEMRTQLEVYLLRLAIPAATPEDIKQIEAALVVAEIATPEDWAVKNLAFHHALYGPANRPVIAQEIERLYWSTFRPVHSLIKNSRDMRRSKKEHRDLLMLARQGEAEKACALLERHILFNGRSVLEALQALEAGK